MDDRSIADTVNTVRDIALNHHHTEQLRARLAHVLVPHLKRIAKLESVQGVLLGALKEARQALQAANDTPAGPIRDTIWMIDTPETLFDFMDSTLAAVQERATCEKCNSPDLCKEYGRACEHGETQDPAASSNAAIKYALDKHADGGMEFLRCWFYGDFGAIRNEWPDAPEAVFRGADPLYKSPAQKPEGGA